MTAEAAAAQPSPPAPPLPRWLPALLLALLVLPLHPYWFDFEQVRRGLWLLLAGVALLVWPQPARLPRGVAVAGAALLGWLSLSFLLHGGGRFAAGALAGVEQLGWLLALFVALRLGAAAALPSLLAQTAWLLLSASLFGLLQRAGVAAFAGYGTAGEPVSLFGNLNVAAEFTAVAAVAAVLLLPSQRRLATAALLLAGAYLAVNGTRSVLVALPVAFAWLAWRAADRRRDAAFGGSALVAGFGAGLLLGVLLPAPATTTPDPAAAPFVQQRYRASLPLRLEIARSGLRMLADAPVFGTGPGFFAVEYPRYRSQREIEITSYGRQFASMVDSAHDDWLQLAIEGGVPALLLLAALFVQLLRGGALAAPLVALAVLMLARAPLGNAPAAVVALLLAGRGVGLPARQRSAAAAGWRVVGLGLLLLGALPVAANCAFAGYLRTRVHGAADLAALQRARRLAPWTPAFAELQAREQLRQQPPDLGAAHAAALAALALRPHEPQFHLLRAEIAAASGDLATAREDALAVLRVDPGSPEARVLLSAVYLQQGNHDAAARIVYEDPHPRLRARLPQHFRELEQLAKQRGDAAGEARYAAERSLLTLLPLLGNGDAGSLQRAALLGPTMLKNFQAAGRKDDVRALAAAALLALDAGQPELAAQFGSRAARAGASFEPWQRALFGDQLLRLQAVLPWRAVLTLE